MNDQLIFDNYLLLLKSTVEVYVHGTLESAGTDVNQLLNECLNDTLTMQHNTYQLMVENGWYNVSKISCDEIKKVLDKEHNKLEDESV